jgi:hypothetical protein
MRYFIDTEFSETGAHRPIELISIGIYAENGDKFYAVSSEFSDEMCNKWVIENVLPHLGDTPRMCLRNIADAIKAFIAKSGEKPEFWGYYSDYDWVVFCQIFGAMIDLPDGWPMFCLDIKQACHMAGNPKLPPQDTTEHNALNDARWNWKAWLFLFPAGVTE